ncbi:hypothetical protein EYF80_022177 [Liparis tanakae]|uniref:Uncharacterized protein n=1 Tax=Liparis tanakae TaxID=230148 RepID=A0A4Z2HP67_9TELE|nr:hypothetical protein EYF80_022177 [Liparis tanakae]
METLCSIGHAWGAPRGAEGGRLPFQRARGVCVLPLLIPISRETGARRARDRRDGGHCFDGTAEEATVGGPLPERAHPASPVVLEDAPAAATETSRKSSSGFGRQGAAEGLDLLGDEGGGGYVGVAEIADLLEGLARGRQRIHVKGG